MNVFKYGILLGFLIWTVSVKGQQVEIRYEGQEPIWLSEQHHFVWDKMIPLHFENGKAIYGVNRVPKVCRLTTASGFSSWFFVGRKDRVTVTVLGVEPLNIKVEGDIAGMYYYELDDITREYTQGKLEMTEDYMKAWLDKDDVLTSQIDERIERLKARRDSAYMRVLGHAIERGRLEEVLVYANIPLKLKNKIAGQLKKEGKASSRMLNELDLYSKIYTPAYVYYNYYYPYVWQEQINLLGAGQAQRASLMEEVLRIMQQEFYNTLCNRIEEKITRENLVEYAWSISDFDYCVGVHMELDDRVKRDSALNIFSGRMEKMYRAKSGKMIDFSFEK